MTTKVMTVLGAIPADQMGTTLPHEHLFLNLHRVTMNDDEILDDVPLAIKEVRDYQDAGGSCLVDVTSLGMGRKPAELRTVAEETGLHIIMGCGWYKERFFSQEVTDGSIWGVPGGWPPSPESPSLSRCLVWCSWATGCEMFWILDCVVSDNPLE